MSVVAIDACPMHAWTVTGSTPRCAAGRECAGPRRPVAGGKQSIKRAPRWTDTSAHL